MSRPVSFTNKNLPYPIFPYSLLLSWIHGIPLNVQSKLLIAIYIMTTQ